MQVIVVQIVFGLGVETEKTPTAKHHRGENKPAFGEGGKETNQSVTEVFE